MLPLQSPSQMLRQLRQKCPRPPQTWPPLEPLQQSHQASSPNQRKPPPQKHRLQTPRRKKPVLVKHHPPSSKSSRSGGRAGIAPIVTSRASAAGDVAGKAVVTPTRNLRAHPISQPQHLPSSRAKAQQHAPIKPIVTKQGAMAEIVAAESVVETKSGMAHLVAIVASRAEIKSASTADAIAAQAITASGATNNAVRR